MLYILVSREELDHANELHPAFLQVSSSKSTTNNSTSSSNSKPNICSGSSAAKVDSKSASSASASSSASAASSVSAASSASSAKKASSAAAAASSSSSKPPSPASASASSVKKPTAPDNLCGCSTPSSSSSSKSKTGCPTAGDPYVDDDNNSDGTLACESGKKATNAVGHLGPKNYAITKSPFKVFTCDQVLLIEGTTFIDPNNYLYRKSAFFTLSAYVINHFDKKNPDNLRTSILADDITEVPSAVFGAPDCVSFVDNKTMKKIDMCFANPGLAQQIIYAYHTFMKCRMGDSLKKITSLEIKKIFKSACLGRNFDVPDQGAETQFNSYLKSFLPPVIKNKINGKINPAFGNKIPGQLR